MLHLRKGHCILTYLSYPLWINYDNAGITISGLEDSLTVGQSAAINCTTITPVTSIEWKNQSSELIMSTAVNLTVLEYTIPLVTDDLQGQQFTCIAVAEIITYNETIQIEVNGIHGIWTISACLSYHFL